MRVESRKNAGAKALGVAAAIFGALGTIIEAFIAVTTLLSGYWFGMYDVAGTLCGLLAFGLIWRRPLLAAVLWLIVIPLLWNGRLLISAALLFVPLLPLFAAVFAFAAWYWARRPS